MPKELPQIVWWHGTSRRNAQNIRRTGFRAGTWFAKHLEDALEFGGTHVFSVRFCIYNGEHGRMPWQVCLTNKLPIRAIRDYRVYKVREVLHADDKIDTSADKRHRQSALCEKFRGKR